MNHAERHTKRHKRFWIMINSCFHSVMSSDHETPRCSKDAMDLKGPSEISTPFKKQETTVRVTSDQYTKIIISRLTEGPNCSVCVGEGSSQTCGTRQVVTESQTTLVNFTCSKPQDVFTVEINRDFGSALAVDAILPRGQSKTDFISASGLPADYTMTWNFVLPPKHNFTVDFIKHNQPDCQSKPVKVTYKQVNMATVEKSLTDDQPTNYQGSFNLSLTNCDVKSAGAPIGQGLFLHFQVSVFRGGFPGRFVLVDLQSDKGLSLQIEKKNQDSFCEIGMNAVVQERIVVPAGSKANLSFLDCLKSDLVLTATKTIECGSLSLCSVSGALLTVPVLDSCLLPSLSQVIWVLNVPDQGSVELSSPQGNLHQSVPGLQECDSLLSMLVSAADGVNIGRFCSASKGIIQRVQISSNVTITSTEYANKDLRQETAPVLNVSFETLIYTVTPLITTPALLMTPNWPEAMKPDSTVSWIINVPEDYSAQLCFTNVSLPQCRTNHAEIKIQEEGSNVETAFREDEQLVLEHNILKSFYLNMSNCEPEFDKFVILSKISLQQKPGKLVSIILGAVGALLAVLIILLAVVCVRKKKRQITNRSSIYIPKGVASLPGDASFPKTRTDNESHVYTSIDETMVYTHLLEQDGGSPGHFNGHQVDSYRGPVDKTIKDPGYEQNAERGPDKDTYRPFLAPSDSFIPSRPRTPLGPSNSLEYEDRRMVDNVLYTFKTPSDVNPIRLSAAEPGLLPEPDLNSNSEPEVDPEYDVAM
ncbi:CUB domain-containing protein 1 [Bagarius yarrelli]|uniref:CUB domain-containing protein 1 n=1 Tax=Bagarius yarrelli TaxID=175774 RepID=A0A556VUF0_BAGYA|nr:CUB domain-containing protein 1 [Bagarius yarrelli]